jgi:hypothetical protein
MMQSAIHLKTKVLPGGKIELELPQANEGEDVDVFVIISTPKTSESRPSVIDILDEIHRRRPHGRSTEEIDRELQAERDAWDN